MPTEQADGAGRVAGEVRGDLRLTSFLTKNSMVMATASRRRLFMGAQRCTFVRSALLRGELHKCSGRLPRMWHAVSCMLGERLIVEGRADC